MKKIILAIDFDGVIHGYSKGWQDGTIYDPPKENTKWAMDHLKRLGYELVIFSTRNYDRTVDGIQQKNQIEEIRNYLNKYNIPYDRIHTDAGKPLCKLFLDDNAIRFDNWTQSIIDITRFVPITENFGGT